MLNRSWGRGRLDANEQTKDILHRNSLGTFQPSQCFLPGTPVSSINKTDSHDTAEILLKVALNTITLSPYFQIG